MREPKTKKKVLKDTEENRAKYKVGTESRLSVRPVAVDARALVTIEVTSSVWLSGTLPAVKGAIVKVFPPAGAEDEKIAAVKDALLKAGAVALRVMPRAKGGETVVRPKAHVDRPHQSIRKVVEAMVEEANSKDRPRLKTIVESVMSKVGI